jgi:type I restriction enzyme M protein
LRVRALDVEFEWFPGLAASLQQKGVAGLHAGARRPGVKSPLEISSKSPEALGRSLSAFNLAVAHSAHGRIPLESAFQSAKAFGRGGPFEELATRTPREAKAGSRLRSSGLLIRFQWDGQRFPTRPTTAFYDYLYLQALALLDEETRAGVRERDGFSDIAFNPDRSLNCQARSAALYVSLARDGYETPWTLAFPEVVEVAFGSAAQ